MKRSVLLAGASFIVLASSARADDLTIAAGTTVTTPVATSAAANSTPGDITVEANGSVAITARPDGAPEFLAAVTLDSDNSVSNSGTISNSLDTNAIGVEIKGGFTGSFTNIGTISNPAPGAGLIPVGLGQYGVRLDGAGVFTGDIVTMPASKITIYGISPYGMSIESELAGDLLLGGTVSVFGGDAVGVSVTAPVSGVFSNTGKISTGSGNPGTEVLHTQAGAAVAIQGSIGGGFLNAGPVSGVDATPEAAIEAIGDQPALFITPVIGGPAGIDLGVLADLDNPGFSFINRGNITADGAQPGVNSIAILLGTSAGGSGALDTTFAGGIFNRGTISAAATSDTSKATRELPSAADATAMIFGAGAAVPELVNDAAGTISAVTGGPLGGSAIALSVQSFASLPSLTNAGNITAEASATDDSVSALTVFGIRDLSGTLTSIENSGVLSATSITAGAGTRNGVAASLSAADTVTTFMNTGIVVGDILFGGAAGNQLTIEGAGAMVSGQVQASGAGTVNIGVSAGGSGGKLVTGGVRRGGTLTVGALGELDISIGRDLNAIIRTTGNASFHATSRVYLTPVLLPANGTYTLIHSDAELTFADFAATTSTVEIPFLFTGGLDFDAGEDKLFLTLQRKSAAAVGLTGDAATIYEPAISAALKDDPFGVQILGIASTAGVQELMEQLTPMSIDAPKAMALSLTDSATGPVGVRQRTIMVTPNTNGNVGVWGQGFHNILDSTNGDGYDADGNGGVFGADWGHSESGHFGAAIMYYRGMADEKTAAARSVELNLTVVSAYMGYRFEDIFLNAQVALGFAGLEGARSVTAGSLTRVATTTDWSGTLGTGASVAAVSLESRVVVGGITVTASGTSGIRESFPAVWRRPPPPRIAGPPDRTSRSPARRSHSDPRW